MTTALGKLMVDFQQMAEFEQDPLVLARGDGVRVWDVEGKEYIDGISAVLTVNLGHANPRIVAAVAEQLGRLALAAPTTGTSDRMLELTERLLGLLPPQFGCVKLGSGGSEAVEAAIKLARQYHRQTGGPGRFKVIARQGAYHGATLGALSATGQMPYREPYAPLVPGFLHAAPLDAGAIEEAILDEGPSSVAAVIAEPVMAMAGVLVPPPDYLRRVREICDRHGVLLIYDEIITGFGRLGAWFGAERFGAWPDLLVLGKGMTGGYAALSAVVMTHDVAAAFRGAPDDHVQFLSGHTFGGNPVACAAGLAAIAELEATGAVENAARMGERLRLRLDELAARHRVIRDVRSCGLLACADLGDEAVAARVVRAARAEGLLTLPSSSGGVRLGPPLTVTAAEVDEVVERLDRGFAAV